ncbi:MAG: four helix bundle protein [Phycisphaerae bacterium]|nr:four helix bundle protein [Phycisphaerae bacterium]
MRKETGSRDILDRSARFCDRCIQVALNLTRNGVCWEIARQLTRSSGSVGANIEEAQATTTRNDFIYRMSVALREARETRFWLRRIQSNQLLKPERLADLIQESEEMVAILTAIVRNTRDSR